VNQMHAAGALESKGRRMAEMVRLANCNIKFRSTFSTSDEDVALWTQSLAPS